MVAAMHGAENSQIDRLPAGEGTNARRKVLVDKRLRKLCEKQRQPGFSWEQNDRCGVLCIPLSMRKPRHATRPFELGTWHIVGVL
jgi:hypothetical protein